MPEFLTFPRERCGRGHPGHCILGGLRGDAHSNAPRCRDGGCRTQWPVQWKVWVKMKRNSHSMRKLSNLRLGGRFPSHANTQNQLWEKGAVTMALAGTLQIWSEKTKSGKLFLKAKRSGPFIPCSQHPCESEQEARMLKSNLTRTKQVRKDPKNRHRQMENYIKRQTRFYLIDASSKE